MLTGASELHLNLFESLISDHFEFEFVAQTTFWHIETDRGNQMEAVPGSVFVIDGAFEIANEKLKKRDALGVWNTDSIKIETQSVSEILLMEVPMEL